MYTHSFFQKFGAIMYQCVWCCNGYLYFGSYWSKFKQQL